MKDYKRLTKWVINKFSQKPEAHLKDKHSEPIVAITRLAEFEDKIESGELVDRDEYIDRLMAAKDTSGMTDKEIKFFAKHDVKVCKEVVKECLQVLRDIRIACIYDDFSWGWDDGIDKAIKQLTERYNIDTED